MSYSLFYASLFFPETRGDNNMCESIKDAEAFYAKGKKFYQEKRQ